MNGDEKASFDEVYDYLRKYNPDISIKKVNDFMARRDINGKLLNLDVMREKSISA